MRVGCAGAPLFRPRRYTDWQMDDEPVPADELLLRHAHAAGLARAGGLALSFGEFARIVDARVHDRLVALDLEPTTERMAAAVKRLCLEDLVLAIACDRGEPGAWTVLRDEYMPRLVGLATKQGKARADAEDLAESLLADLALPPPRRPAAATLLGTFQGWGSLFGWLATILVRRIAAGARRKSPERLSPDHAAHRAAQHGDPTLPSDEADVVAVVSAALRDGLARCTPRERLVLVLKHRDDLPHRDIAATLGVGVPRVSQVLHRAHQRLRDVAVPRLPDGLEQRTWAVAVATAARALATLPTVAPPTIEGHEAGGGR